MANNNQNFKMMKQRAEQMMAKNPRGLAPNILPGVKPADLKEITCKHCGGEVFVPVHTVKFASRFQSANGIPTMVQFPLGFACITCDGINPFDQEAIEGGLKEEEKPADLGVSVDDGIKTKEKLS